MTFGEKLLNARQALGLSQAELAAKAGITERSLYTYEQLGIIPRTSNIKRLAEALGVSLTYLMDDGDNESVFSVNQDIFLANVKNEYGSKGAREASEVLQKASALFAGGELDDEAKEIFFQSLMEIYLDSKAEARAKFSPKSKASRREAEKKQDKE